MVGGLAFNGSGSVNPNFGLSLDTDEFTLSQDLVIAAVPEPSALSLGALGLLVIGCLRAARRGGRMARGWQDGRTLPSRSALSRRGLS